MGWSPLDRREGSKNERRDGLSSTKSSRNSCLPELPALGTGSDTARKTILPTHAKWLRQEDWSVTHYPASPQLVGQQSDRERSVRGCSSMASSESRNQSLERAQKRGNNNEVEAEVDRGALVWRALGNHQYCGQTDSGPRLAGYGDFILPLRDCRIHLYLHSPRELSEFEPVVVHQYSLLLRSWFKTGQSM